MIGKRINGHNNMEVVGPDDGETELFEDDWEELTPVHISRTRRSSIIPPPSQAPIKCGQVNLRELMLSRPACVDFEADRIEDSTPPPATPNHSLAPLAASCPSPGLEDEIPSALFPRQPKWGSIFLALAGTVVVGIIGLRYTDWSLLEVGFNARSPKVAAVGAQIPVSRLPQVVAEQPPANEEPGQQKQRAQIDVRGAPTAKLPSRETTRLVNRPNDSPPTKRPFAPAAQHKPDKTKTDESDQTDNEELEKPTESVPEPARPPFDRSRAAVVLNAAAAAAGKCSKPGGTAGSARVSVTFAPSGRVTTAVVQSGPLTGTAAGGCVARLFRKARVEPFEGGLVTVHKTVRIQ